MLKSLAQVPAKHLQASARILMCRPTYFQVKYSINPWMDVHKKVNQEKAMKQWDLLKQTIEESGAEVEVMEAEGAEMCPDLVFTANSALVRGDKAFIGTFRFNERKGEQKFYKKWFERNGYKVVFNLDVPFEGTGDALWAGDSKIFCGVGQRTVCFHFHY